MTENIYKADMLGYIKENLSKKLPRLTFQGFPSKKFMSLSYPICYSLYWELLNAPHFFEASCIEFGLFVREVEKEVV